MTYLFPPGAILVERAGARKQREAATQARKASEALRRPIRLATDLILNADREDRARRDHLAAMTAEAAAVVVEIAATKAKLAELKAEALPAAQARVEAAQVRVDALVGDVERAERIANANTTISGGVSQ